MFAISDPISHSDSLAQSTNPVDTTHLRVDSDRVRTPADRLGKLTALRSSQQSSLVSSALYNADLLTINDLMMPNVHLCSINDAL